MVTCWRSAGMENSGASGQTAASEPLSLGWRTHVEGVAAGQNDCLHHDPSQYRDLQAPTGTHGKPALASCVCSTWRVILGEQTWVFVASAEVGRRKGEVVCRGAGTRRGR